jgi:ankyrin repeat protein
MLVGHEVVVEALLVTSLVGADARDEYGRTPLSWAAGEGQEGIVRLLLDTGQVNVDTRYEDSPTPLLYTGG